MNKYIIKYTFIWNGKSTEDYAIREGFYPDDVKLAFIDKFKSDKNSYLLSINSIEELSEEGEISLKEKIDLKTEIEKLKASAKEMLETLEKIKL